MGETAICLSCRHFDPKPGLAENLDEHYGVCRWPLPPLPLPIVMMQHGLIQVSASIANRMIPHRGLAERPDLWRACLAHDAMPEPRHG